MRSRAGSRCPTSGSRSPAAAQHEITVPTDDHKTIVHPELGDIELDCQILFTQSQGQALLVFTATPGTEGYEKLQMLSVIGTQQLTPDPGGTR